MKSTWNILRRYMEDIFIGIGLLFINIATFQWNRIAGFYCVGITLLIVGIVLARQPPARR